MTDAPNAALLPEGFYDVLPPDAAQEAAVIERMMAVLGGHGFDRVKPPLLEFEDTLLSGVGASMARHTFRLMDPMGSRMLGLRADMTVQVARIARSRLAAAPRPLRLAYAGQVLQVRGTQLRPERQFAQVGAELIGGAQPAADAEAALLAVEALQAVGVDRLALDLTEPTLVPALLGALNVDGGAATALRHALDRKDAAVVAQLGGAAAAALGGLLAVSGPADAALAALAGIDLPAVTRPILDRLAEVVRLIRASAPDLMVTVDFVEHRGFEYHTGVAFTLFARGARGEVGRGGRYRADGAGGRGGDRLHPLHGHGAARGHAAEDAAPGVPAARHRTGRGRCPQGRRLCHHRRARSRHRTSRRGAPPRLRLGPPGRPARRDLRPVSTRYSDGKCGRGRRPVG